MVVGGLRSKQAIGVAGSRAIPMTGLTDITGKTEMAVKYARNGGEWQEWQNSDGMINHPA